MRTIKFTKRGPALAIVTAASLALLLTSSALAAGAGAVSVTETFHNATTSFPAVNFCSGETGTVELTYNGVAHATFLTGGNVAGTGHATFTATGDFVFTPDDPAGVTITGHVTTWDGENSNLQNYAATATFIGHGTGSDGSTLTYHDVAHFSVSASGITISFDKPSCG
jgi:hypothetical protein